LGTERGTYVASVLGAAITKANSIPESDPATTSYRQKVWELAQKEFPQLQIDEPRPTREAWVMQKYEGYYVKYKHFATVGSGYHKSVVDLELPGQADELATLREKYSQELAQIGGRVEQATKSAAFRIEVRRANPPEFDEAITREALDAWARLLAWWREKSN
jgi:hypothetical protein